MVIETKEQGYNIEGFESAYYKRVGEFMEISVSSYLTMDELQSLVEGNLQYLIPEGYEFAKNRGIKPIAFYNQEFSPLTRDNIIYLTVRSIPIVGWKRNVAYSTLEKEEVVMKFSYTDVEIDTHNAVAKNFVVTFPSDGNYSMFISESHLTLKGMMKGQQIEFDHDLIKRNEVEIKKC